MKRFQQALQEDGAYNSVSFSYEYDTPETAAQHKTMQSGKLHWLDDG